jgi:myo-inositol-1(or 4)-monophosphatase
MNCQKFCSPLSDAEQVEFIPFLQTLVLAAFGEIQTRFLENVAVDTKADASPVTEADRQTEALLRRLIEARYPEHGILGEEFGTKTGVRYRWVLDPIDGTRAFISNCFLFGTLIALERDDGQGFSPVLGTIAHAATGLYLIGHTGQTSLYRQTEVLRSVRVRPPRSLANATVLSTCAPGSHEQGNPAGMAALYRDSGMARTWGDCFGYFSVATGGADLMMDPVLAYWDVAAIVPVLEGAGATLSSWQGGNPLIDISLLASTHPELHAEALSLIGAPKKT